MPHCMLLLLCPHHKLSARCLCSSHCQILLPLLFLLLRRLRLLLLLLLLLSDL